MPLAPLAASIAHPHSMPLRYFISDLHLDGTASPRSEKFKYFLSKLSDAARDGPVELYIVGDLFEFWYEYRPQIFALYANDLNALERAWKSGVNIFLFYGNRDFAYGDYVLKRFGATVLGDGASVELNDSRRAWLEHGDLLCTSDLRYLRFRKIIRGPFVRVLFRLLPWRAALKQIEKIRARTLSDKKQKDANVFGIDLDAARARLAERQCQLLICGHTHAHKMEDLGAGLRLIVLPPWCDHASGYVNDGMTFKTFEVGDDVEI